MSTAVNKPPSLAPVTALPPRRDMLAPSRPRVAPPARAQARRYAGGRVGQTPPPPWPSAPLALGWVCPANAG